MGKAVFAEDTSKAERIRELLNADAEGRVVVLPCRVGKGLSSYGELIGCLEDAPAANVAPVRHGRWKKSGSLLECQYCGEIYSQLGGNAGKSWNYCPNCGAKME